MLTTWFMPAPSLPSEARVPPDVVRTSCANVTLPLSGGNGTPTWPEMKIQEPARVSMRNASLKVGAIGLGRCLRRSMALLPTVLLFNPLWRVRALGRAHFGRSAHRRVRLLHAQASRYTCRRFITRSSLGCRFPGAEIWLDAARAVFCEAGQARCLRMDPAHPHRSRAPS